jgi:hypothetical protein
MSDGIGVEPIDTDRFRATVSVTITGTRAGAARRPAVRHQIDHPKLPTRTLVGFQPVVLESGETTTVTIEGNTRPVGTWTGKEFTPGVATVVVEAASYAGDPRAVTAVVDIPD